MNSWSSFHDFLCWFHLRPASLSMVHALADKVCPHSIHLMTKKLRVFPWPEKSKILGCFHLIFWSNSSTLDNAWHRILGHVLAFGGQMCSSLVFLWNSEETNFENKKSRMSYSWALDQARLLPWPFLKFSWNTAAALRDLPCWSLNCTGRLIFLENIWSTSQTFKCETG